MTGKIVLSAAGMAAMLQSPGVQSAVDAAAESMAASLNVQAHDGPAPITTDRFSAPYGDGRGVTIAHPGGIGLEAEHGYLMAAARSAGLMPGRKK